MKEIHIGKEIEDRLKRLRMTKTEFAHMIGVPQQNVNRILNNPIITTDKLQLISEVLRFNFFDLYREGNNGDINCVANGASSIAAVNSDVSTTTDCAVLQERVRNLEQIIVEKERLIQLLLRDGQHNVQ